MRRPSIAQRWPDCIRHQPHRHGSRTYAVQVTRRSFGGDDKLFEEERPAHSDAKTKQSYAAIHPGRLLHRARYRLVSKLGWGCTSTIWLARDLQAQRWQWQRPAYVVIKLLNANVGSRLLASEKRAMDVFAKADQRHPGAELVRRTIDSFELRAARDGKADGVHQCFVYEALQTSMEEQRRKLRDGRFPLELVKLYAGVLLTALDFLHTQCYVVHSDLKLENFLFSFGNEEEAQECVKNIEDAEVRYKETQRGRIYETNPIFDRLPYRLRIPIITDFGNASFFKKCQPGSFSLTFGYIQPIEYRAPEVHLQWGWSYSADIWSMGLLIWYMAAGKDLLPQLIGTNPHNTEAYLGAMVSIMGLPSHDLVVKKMDLVEKVQRDPTWTRDSIEHHFDRETCNFKHKDLIPERRSLRKLATFLHDDADNAITETDQEQFLDFISSILKWDPKERPSARQLLDHPWLGDCEFAKRIDESRGAGEARQDWQGCRQ